MIETEVTLGKIKLKQGIAETNTDNDSIIRLMISDAMEAICVYCHRTPCPDRLEYLVREIVNSTIAADNAENIASIKRGDMQISYNTTITVDSYSPKQITAMNSFRKLRIH